MNHKEMTAHIRKRVKCSGISARVFMDVCCGNKRIIVCVPNAATTFSDSQQKEIALIAKCNGLQYVRATAIDETATTNPQQFNFYM